MSPRHWLGPRAAAHEPVDRKHVAHRGSSILLSHDVFHVRRGTANREGTTITSLRAQATYHLIQCGGALGRGLDRIDGRSDYRRARRRRMPVVAGVSRYSSTRAHHHEAQRFVELSASHSRPLPPGCRSFSNGPKASVVTRSSG